MQVPEKKPYSKNGTSLWLKLSLNCSCCSKCMARCILCPLAKLMSGDEVLAAILGLGGRNYQSVYCSYNFSFVTFIHFPGWQKPPWTTSLVRFGSLWAPSEPPPSFSSTPNPSWWAKRGVAALVGEHHHLPTPTQKWRWSSTRTVTVHSQESNLSQLLDSHHLWSNFQLSAFHVWLSERKIYFSSTLPGPLPSVVSSAFTTGNWLGTETQDVLVTEHPQLSHTAPQLLILISEQLALPENKSLSPSLLVSSAQHRLCSENWTSATRECKYHQLGLWKEVADPLDMTWQQSISSTGQPGLSERGRFWWRFRRNHCFKTKQKIYLI